MREQLTTYDICALGAKSSGSSTVIDATLVPTVKQDETLRVFYDLISRLLTRMEELGFIKGAE